MDKSVAPILLVTISLIVSNSASRYSVSQFQDIKVSNTDGVIQCDQVECPEGSVRCHVVKQNSEENLSKVARENICYDADDNILKEKSWTEEDRSMKKINLHIDMNADGRTSIINTQHSHSEAVSQTIADVSQG